jgi:hypothetical protein
VGDLPGDLIEEAVTPEVGSNEDHFGAQVDRDLVKHAPSFLEALFIRQFDVESIYVDERLDRALIAAERAE